MRSQSVAIVGYGAVGKTLHQLFPPAVVYDEPLGVGSREAVNGCRFAFVAVPTNPRSDGSCDTSIVEDVLDWLEAPIVILRSTVAVGTTARLRAATGKRIVFQPEFWGDAPDHPFSNPRRIGWMVLGGDRPDTNAVADLYKKVFGAELSIFQTDSTTAELTKYMTNCFLALKVTFCNEIYDLAQLFGVDYNELRELWLLDSRIGRSHTFVQPDERGFGGKCFPKDASALVSSANAAGYVPMLLTAMLKANARFRALNEPVAVPSVELPGENGHRTTSAKSDSVVIAPAWAE
jgi:UDPglucose 6-dehydrogenase